MDSVHRTIAQPNQLNGDSHIRIMGGFFSVVDNTAPPAYTAVETPMNHVEDDDDFAISQLAADMMGHVEDDDDDDDDDDDGTINIVDAGTQTTCTPEQNMVKDMFKSHLVSTITSLGPTNCKNYNLTITQVNTIVDSNDFMALMRLSMFITSVLNRVLSSRQPAHQPERKRDADGGQLSPATAEQ
jgi:hypothetical protein